MIRAGAPEKAAWGIALGLTVTLVWLYIEILRLLSSGKSLTEIAWMVHSSYKTVANTSSIMRQKLGVRTSAELMRLAIENHVA